MPPKGTRRTRTTRVAENTSLERKENDTADGLNKVEVVTESLASLSDFQPKENGSHVNGKPVQKSAAQKKREKRKQRRREGSVMSDAESVYSLSEYTFAKTTQVASAATNIQPSREPTLSILDTIDIDLDPDDPQYNSLRKVFHHFEVNEEGEESLGKEAPGKGEIYYSDDDDVPMAEDEDSNLDGLSRKRARRLNRPSVAQLKQLVDKPEIVEWTDVAAQDPQLLIHLRGYRNMIPVPSHWGQKRDYLASKRGVAKQPYELPSFIRDTGIQEMRNPHDAQTQSLRQKMRERVQGKLGKLDVDYQKLHDAFFRYQTKPPLTVYGEIYYEGKEFETNFKHKRPGEISNELKEALNIPPGAPPPWLINMQRYGPPPSFPNLKIPGLNAPIPAGAKWGFHPGGWGKPPVDEFNKPLYGDVFGVMEKIAPPAEQAPVERELWGEIEEVEVEVDEVEESEEEENEDMIDEMDMDGIPTNAEQEIPSGLETPSGLTSTVPSGLETPDFLELRKSRFDIAPDAQTQEQRDLFRVLSDRQQKKGFLGGQGYDISAPTLDDEATVRVYPYIEAELIEQESGYDVALDPEQLENLTKAELRALHDKEAAKQITAKKNYGQHEDMSDLVVEHAELQAKKRKMQEEKKKSKFKF
jgi:splicing factor 3B subunit 2